MPFRSHSAACVSHCCFSLCLRGRGLLVCFYHAAYVPHCRVFLFFFSDPGACLSLCLCFLVAVPGACVSFFIRLRTFRIDVFGFSSSRSDLFYFFVVSVCTFRIAAFFRFLRFLGRAFRIAFFVCFRSGARDFCVPSVPHRFVCFSFVFVVRCRSAGHVSHSPFLGGLCLGDGVVLLSPPGPTRRFLSRHGAYVSHRCVFFPIVFFYPAGSICRGAKIRCSRSLYASLKG